MAMVIFVPAGFVFVLCMELMFEDLMRADRQKQRQTVEVMQLVMLLFLVPFALIPREYRCLRWTAEGAARRARCSFFSDLIIFYSTLAFF